MNDDLRLAGRHAVVVLSYYGRSDTLACLESIRSTAPSCALVVVDNGSYDGVLEEAARRWPQVVTVQTGRNAGFTGGMNAGLTVALDGGASVVTVLNNDTEVEPDALDRLAAAAASGSVVSPEISQAPGDALWFGGGVVEPASGLPRHLTAQEVAERYAPGAPRSVDLLTGCCLTATAGTWRRVGLFDERYFLMFEDSDWSLRARARLVDLVVLPEARIRHRVSASFNGPYRYLGLYYYLRNGLLFQREHVRGGPVTAGRFVRRHVVPRVTGPARGRQVREAVRVAAMLAVAVAHHTVRRYGRAPARLERRCARWVRDQTADAPAG